MGTVVAVPEATPSVGGSNAGAQHATGDAIVLLNPDSVPAPGCLDALRAPPAEWDAWMGVVTMPGGERVNTAGGESHFLGFSWSGRLGERTAFVYVDRDESTSTELAAWASARGYAFQCAHDPAWDAVRPFR